MSLLVNAVHACAPTLLALSPTCDHARNATHARARLKSMQRHDLLAKHRVVVRHRTRSACLSLGRRR